MKNLLLPFVYPSVCLTCDDLCSRAEYLLCDTCALSLELAECQGRCPRCFYPRDGKKCLKCPKDSSPFSSMAFCFEGSGPPLLLASHFMRSGKSYLAKSLAAFLVIQFCRLKWPYPDLILACPSNFLQRLLIGCHPDIMLGKEFAAFLNVPFIDGLKKGKIKSGVDIKDKTILLVDSFPEEETLSALGLALTEGYPHNIYALSVLKPSNPLSFFEEKEHGCANRKHGDSHSKKSPGLIFSG